MYSFQDPWFQSECGSKSSSNLVRATLYPLHRNVGYKNVLKIVVKILIMWLILAHLLLSLENPSKLTISWVVMTDVSYSKQYTGKTTHDFRYKWKYYKSNSRKFDRKFGKNIFIDSLSVQVTWDSLIVYQLH